jgi:hypothetical protein
MMIRKFMLAAILIAVASPVLAEAQQQGTPEERAACRADTRRLCHKVPQGGDYLGCLRENAAKLSRACKAVLQKYIQI